MSDTLPLKVITGETTMRWEVKCYWNDFSENRKRFQF